MYSRGVNSPRLRPLVPLILISLLAGCGSKPALSTAPVQRQSIAQTVTATGNTTPQDTVLVGSQDSGTIEELLVDYNSPVHVGQVLARLDPSTFVAALAQAKANLAQLEAQRASSQSASSGAAFAGTAAAYTARSQREQIAAADDAVRKATSTYALALLTQRRDAALLRDGYVAQNVYDNDVTATAAARAGLTAAQVEAQSVRELSAASSNQARSSLSQSGAAAATVVANAHAVDAAEAIVAQAQINLDHATITSPVDGTVVQRNVSVGQTVAAALQAPTLFTIAKDLGKMEVDIQVGEPDVGTIRDGQRVDFTVLAYPGRNFTARVAQVRQNPTIVNNVTTYTTVAYADNRNGLLRPGMTANATIAVANYPDALVVPLAALQWRPSAAARKAFRIVAPPLHAAARSGSVWGTTTGASAAAVSIGSVGRVYVLEGGTLRGVSLRILAISGTTVGVATISGGGALAQGDPVAIGEGALPRASDAP